MLSNKLAFGVADDTIKVGDGFLAILPMFHAFGLAIAVHTPLSAGMMVVLLPRFDAKECVPTRF